MKNVIHVFGVSGSGTTMARLCHSAFVRVATSVQTIYSNLTELCHSAFVRVATMKEAKMVRDWLLCHSAFARVATISAQYSVIRRLFATAHSCGLRRACCQTAVPILALPQRIRAGCDENLCAIQCTESLCHSAFARVATASRDVNGELAIFATAHSCGLRQERKKLEAYKAIFATAHSCGLRLKKVIKRCIISFFATAHSCGLRPVQSDSGGIADLLCHSAFVRVATLVVRCKDCVHFLCHSAFVRVATAEKQCSALRICCEKVDSFSSVGESGLALTIFPFSFAAKATYVAINDSFGRAIDRFFGANRTGISVSYDFAEHPCL